MLRDGLLLLGGGLALCRRHCRFCCCALGASRGECYSADMSALPGLLTEYECDIPDYSLSMSARNRAAQHSYS